MIGALVGHLVGDYILQNDWMALNKKTSTFHCAVHCAVWTACVVVFAGVDSVTVSDPPAPGYKIPVLIHCNDWASIPIVAVLFVTHFIQDRTGIIRWWMSQIGQDKFASGPCSPWSIIVVDNVWHIVTIWAVWRLLQVYA